MTERDGGRRTFFHNRGANATWVGDDIDFGNSSARIFHLGYLLLLDAIDDEDAEYGTQGAALLARAREAGLKTSIDAVSEDRTLRQDRRSCPQAGGLLHPERSRGKQGYRSEGAGRRKLLEKGIEEASSKLFDLGARELVAIHFPEGSFAQSVSGEKVCMVPWLCPRDTSRVRRERAMPFVRVFFMVSTRGGRLRNVSDGTCAATVCMSDPTCTDGLALARWFGLGRSVWDR